MTKNITVLLEDHPGALAALGETLGNAGVNIDGICGVRCEGKGLVNLLVEKSADAVEAIMNSGMKIVEEREVLVLSIEDKPGELGGIARKLAEADVNINLLYLTASMDLVIGVDHIEHAREALNRE